MRALFSVLLCTTLVSACGFVPVWAASPAPVVAEVYGGGGNAGATYAHDFVELFNRTKQAVDLTTWRVQ